MSSFSLDDIRTAAERKYGSTDITVGDTVCRLINPLRLSKDKRATLMSTQEQLSADDADQEQILADCLRVVSANDHEANVLLGAIGDDLAVLISVFERYTEEQEAGEA